MSRFVALSAPNSLECRRGSKETPTAHASARAVRFFEGHARGGHEQPPRFEGRAFEPGGFMKANELSVTALMAFFIVACGTGVPDPGTGGSGQGGNAGS